MRLLSVLAAALPALAADFARDVEPVLKAKCYACHGAAQQLSGLRLDRRDDALRGGYSGPVIRPGDSAGSRLLHVISGKDPKVKMPPGGKPLSAAEVAAIAAWIDAGAVRPADALTKDTGAKPRHWSFLPLRRAAPPQVRNANWARNEIDRFVLARLETEGITPAPEAARATLIRRVTFDLTGLPPTSSEVAEFLADNRPDAYERLVDRLIASPHYGERWARQWLDLARYADSDGYEKDYVRPYAWRWRHWVIGALNRDMPFDQFTIEQLAGDLLDNATVDQRVATGFHRNTLTNREGGVNIEQFRVEQVVDRAATVGTAWLGLTFGCAQCHDHKYDPITQKDFYQLFAFFNTAGETNIDAPLAGEMGPYLAEVEAYRAKRAALLAEYKVPELMPAWEAQMKEARANPGKWTDWDHAYDAFQKYQDNADRILDTPLDRRTEKQSTMITDHFVINYHRIISKERWKELNFPDLRKKLEALRAAFPALSEAPVIAEDPGQPRKSYIHIRGDWKRRGVEVAPGLPGFLTQAAGAKMTRVDLARWLVSSDNPLTPRVAVNRAWQEFFGRGLVRTAEDFGAQGERPTHPELLDHLAARFVDSGWRLKSLHRYIVTSAAYRQSSQARPEIDARDAGNSLLARQSRLRLPAESVRDAALAVSELLYPVVGGRSVRPPLPKGVVELSYGGNVKWPESAGRDKYRRGLYIHFQRTVPYPQLMNFDAPDANVAACRRERSTTPLQALNLLNDPVFVESARALAARLLREKSDATAAARVAHLFRITLGREANAREAAASSGYFESQKALFSMDAKAAETFFPLEIRGVTHAESAAWAGLASSLLNTDEFLTRE